MRPFSVRLSNAAYDEHITNRIESLSWRSVVPGGFASAAFRMQSPIDINNPAFDPYTRVYIYDARDGSTLWEGRLQQPGRSSGDDGEVWSLTAIGPSAHALDDVKSLIYVDRDLTNMYRNMSLPAGEAGVNIDPGNSANESALVFRFPNGVTVTTGSNVALIYDRIAQAGMLVGGISYDWDAGVTDANYRVESVFTPSSTVIADNWNTAGGSRAGLSAGASIGTNHTLITLRAHRNAGGATTVGSDGYWASISNVVIRGQVVNRSGVPITGAGSYSAANIFPSTVVADLLGRMLPLYDGANAAIDGGAPAIDQLAYPDPVNADQVLRDLMETTSTHYWAAWESNPTNGKYRFEWRTWPVSPRYEASVVDGFDSPAPTSEQYNRVMVRWRDGRGRIRLGPVSGSVPELTAAGITRTGYIDQSDEVGSAANAIAAGNSFLTDHNRPLAGGSLTIARPIVDVLDQKLVQPWQIKPGQLIRVRGVEASIDLAVNQRDGQTVFRIVSVDVSDDGTAQLELDMFTRTEARALADLLRRRYRKR